MEPEKEKTGDSTKKGSLTWLRVVIVIVILGGVAAWYFTVGNDKDSKTEESATATTVKAPKHADWTKFTSAKYKFTLYYPPTYTLEESAVGTIKLKQGTTEMIDMYVLACNGDEAGMMKSSAALYTDATKNYMAGGGTEASTTVAGTSGKQFTGTFAKNAGTSQTHAGVSGSTVIFTRDDKLFTFDSYDNGDAAAKTIFDDVLYDLSF